ncbi:c-type cytochrome [Gimesia aquarii]|uniref:Cytochrome c domain-containing protein n=1 Tax=Gimesia aquarii TaxID=2527964 RepID=A0A517VVK8_9PLAN|nr:c-type cytochrome [Gimesia aquarii]QDT97042.1 hypothetical protein V144x_25130 [Gimesia aquarii]
MIILRNFSIFWSMVLIPMIFCTLAIVHASEPVHSLKIDGLDEAFLEENSQGEYQIVIAGEPLSRMTGAEFSALRDLEIDLRNQKHSDTQSKLHLNALLIAMARIADKPTLMYLHELFESYPERRNDVAEAISWYAKENQRRDADWRILVRSLNVVEGEQAKTVMNVLTKFRRRSNKAQWIRQVILVGLAQDALGQKIASQLLTHWTGVKIDQSTVDKHSPLLIWQKWFSEKYPDEIKPVLPIEDADSRWKFTNLMSELRKRSKDEINLKLGEQSFVKATCVKCHRFGGLGEKVGPDLTSVSRRLQQKEILLATMFPSHFIPEEYPTFTIVTVQGKVLTGMMGAAANRDQLLILTGKGEKHLIDKKDIDEIIPVKKSSMPEGLLNLLSKEEVLQLISFLATLPDGAPQTYRHKSP